jgi:hypothetical protein
LGLLCFGCLAQVAEVSLPFHVHVTFYAFHLLLWLNELSQIAVHRGDVLRLFRVGSCRRGGHILGFNG